MSLTHTAVSSFALSLLKANDRMKLGVLSEFATKATGLFFPKMICAVAIKEIGMDKEVVTGIYKNLSETLCGIAEVQVRWH